MTFVSQTQSAGKSSMAFLLDLLVLLGQLLKIFVETIISWIIPADYKSVAGEVCLITGAGNGMGRLMALNFAQRKAKLVLWDMDAEANKETGALVEQMGGTAFVDVCDVSDKEEIKKAAKRAREAVGDITILVNNAGIVYAKEVLELSEKQIEQTFKVNTLAHFWIVREFLPHMLKTNHGHIVTLASTVGLFASPGMPDYCSSKHAVVGFHQSLYYDLQNFKNNNIKTTLVCPYHVKTGMFRGVTVTHPWLVPSLTPTECVDSIMHAILTNRPFVAMPRLMYLVYNAATWLPMEAQTLCYRFLGADTAIRKFKPNRPYQLEDS
ncbi:unnamed protein product [Clavelina lepadiformis]|uniref:Uncharacterized protein n=1 Tax=Clavelina lepadiformis TaxID=159417 RepID=A0ABP0F251_CLALP